MAPTDRDTRRDDDGVGNPSRATRIPRIGRGRLLPSFPMAAVMRILVLVVALVFILSMRKACGDGVANWFHIVAPDTTAAPASETPPPPPAR